MLGTITLLGVILLVLVIFVCPLILFACCVSEDKRRKEEANGHVVPDLVDHRTS